MATAAEKMAARRAERRERGLVDITISVPAAYAAWFRAAAAHAAAEFEMSSLPAPPGITGPATAPVAGQVAPLARPAAPPAAAAPRSRPTPPAEPPQSPEFEAEAPSAAATIAGIRGIFGD